LKNEIENEMQNRPASQHILLDELKKEFHAIELQIKEIVLLVSKVKHQRPLLERLDGLEDERIDIENKINKESIIDNKQFMDLSNDVLEDFIENYRNNLQAGEPEKKKAILRTIIDHGVFDGESLEIIPSYQQITGVNLASPRGFEPLLPP